jgi:transcription elongation factor Elf1
MITKPLRPYKPRKLVNGFCIPTGENGKEALICLDCGIYKMSLCVPLTHVTFDGNVKCSACGKALK